ncbi:MAG TPA: type II toxin-antitoxin system RelE/ParE family toxin [Pirellulaceae bacterium]
MEEAAEEWRDLDASVRKKLVSAVQRLKRDPEQYGKQLGQPLHGLRRVRSGDYRIVYRVHKKTKIVEIAVVCHRSKVYEIAIRRGLQ